MRLGMDDRVMGVAEFSPFQIVKVVNIPKRKKESKGLAATAAGGQPGGISRMGKK